MIENKILSRPSRLMKGHLLGLERQITEAAALAEGFSLPPSYQEISNVLFCGLGGSAASGDILRVLSDRSASFPVVVNRSSRLPNWAGRDTLCLFSSYSGNTAEVLLAFRQALKIRAKIFAVTSGGRLADLARREAVPFFLVPQGMPPRCAVGYLSFSLICLFRKMGWLKITEKEIAETAPAIREMSFAKAGALARKMKGRLLHIYAAGGMIEPAAARWRSQLAENAKTLSSHHLAPEMFHNEIEGWNFPGPWVKQSLAIFLADREDPVRERKKRRYVQKMIRSRGAGVLQVDSVGAGPLARLFSLIALGDRASFELALLHHVDPAAVPVLDAVKKIK